MGLRTGQRQGTHGTRRRDLRKNDPVKTTRVSPGVGIKAPKKTDHAATFDGVTAGVTVPVKAGRPSREDLKLAEAANRCMVLLTDRNPAERIRMSGTVEVDPGSPSSIGRDAKGNDVWVVDQKVTYKNAPDDVLDQFFNGFFTGRAKGKDGSGPKMQLAMVDTGDSFVRVASDANDRNGAAQNPMADPSVDRFIVEISELNPLPGSGTIIPSAGLHAMVDTSQVKRTDNSVEFTMHFLNPDRVDGPFPGAADGAVRYRCTKQPDGSAVVEGFYTTKAATDLSGPMGGFIPPMKLGKGLISKGADFMKGTPFSMFGSMAKGMISAAETMTDVGMRMSGGGEVARLGVSKAHASYYRKTLFQNLVYG